VKEAGLVALAIFSGRRLKICPAVTGLVFSGGRLKSGHHIAVAIFSPLQLKEGRLQGPLSPGAAMPL